MYRSCMKNYVNSLKYTFTVLGILALGVLIGLGTFGKMGGQAVTTMTESMKADYDAADLSLVYITDAVVNRVKNITLGDILNIIHERSIEPLIVGSIEDSVEKVVGNYVAFAEQIVEEIQICAAAIVVALIVCVVIILISRVVGFFSVEICVRKRMSSVGMIKLLIEMFVRFLMYAIAAFIIVSLCTAFQDASTVFLCLLPLLLCFFGLIAAWLTSNPKKVSFGKVVNFANFGFLLLANLTMLAITALIGFMVFRLVNIVAAAFVILSLLTVLLVAMDLSASAMAVNAEKKADEPAPEAPAEIPAQDEPAPEAETPADAIVSEAPAEETPAAETPVEETPAAETPSEEEGADAAALQDQLKKRLQGKLNEQE